MRHVSRLSCDDGSIAQPENSNATADRIRQVKRIAMVESRCSLFSANAAHRTGFVRYLGRA
jgi:hypothetical protein